MELFTQVDYLPGDVAALRLSATLRKSSSIISLRLPTCSTIQEGVNASKTSKNSFKILGNGLFRFCWITDIGGTTLRTRAEILIIKHLLSKLETKPIGYVCLAVLVNEEPYGEAAHLEHTYFLILLTSSLQMMLVVLVRHDKLLRPSATAPIRCLVASVLISTNHMIIACWKLFVSNFYHS